MARPKGQPKIGGRVKGTPNKATADIKALAQLHATAAMNELARIMLHGESEAVRVSAIKEFLDRGYGKATQPVSGDDTAPPIRAAIELIFRAANVG